MLSVVSLAAAEMARPLRILNVLLGAALLVTPLLHQARTAATGYSIGCGLVLIVLSIRRAPTRKQD